MSRNRPLASSTLKLYDALRRRSPSPRTRLAVRLHAAGIGTKREVAKALGLHPGTMYLMTMPSINNPEVRSIQQRIDSMLEDETVEMGKVLRVAGRRAVGKIVHTMEQASSEGLQFKAAQDLADRNPETSKTQKIAVASFSLGADDAKELARAMVDAAKVREQFPEPASGDYIKVDADARESLPAHAKRALKHGG